MRSPSELAPKPPAGNDSRPLCGTFYGGDGRWTFNPVEARIFFDLDELLQECRKQRITACKAVEFQPSGGRLGLVLERLR